MVADFINPYNFGFCLWGKLNPVAKIGRTLWDLTPNSHILGVAGERETGLWDAASGFERLLEIGQGVEGGQSKIIWRKFEEEIIASPSSERSLRSLGLLFPVKLILNTPILHFC